MTAAVTAAKDTAKVVRSDTSFGRGRDRNAGIVLDHSTIYDRIWGYDFGPGSKNLAVYVGYLRRKLDEPGAPQLIHTVRGVGYVLRED